MKHSLGKLMVTSLEIWVEGGARSGQEIKKHKLQHRKQIIYKNILSKNKAIILIKPLFYSNFKQTIT